MQIDVGFGAIPFGLDLADEGRIRMIATGNDVISLRTRQALLYWLDGDRDSSAVAISCLGWSLRIFFKLAKTSTSGAISTTMSWPSRQLR